MKPRRKKKRGSWYERWADVIADIDLDTATPDELDPRLAFLLRVGWRARHRDLVRRLEADLDFARSVALGTHPNMNIFRGALTWGQRGKSYDEFKVWRQDLVERGKRERVRLDNRLAQVQAMENPHR